MYVCVFVRMYNVYEDRGESNFNFRITPLKFAFKIRAPILTSVIIVKYPTIFTHLTGQERELAVELQINEGKE